MQSNKFDIIAVVSSKYYCYPIAESTMHIHNLATIVTCFFVAVVVLFLAGSENKKYVRIIR